MNVQSLLTLQREETKQRGGYWEVTEGDYWQNKISRALVRAYKHEHGAAWLGRVNRYTPEKSQPYQLVEYKRGMVHNFDASFVVPVCDLQLVRLLVERECAPYEGTAKDYERVSAIYDRIEKLGGLILRWV
jgi:hypothetical protein